MTIDEAIEERLKVIKVQEKLYEESYSDESKEIIKNAIDNDRQLAVWLTELKELREQIFNLKSDNERLRDCVDSCVRNGELDYVELAKAKQLLKFAIEDFASIDEVKLLPENTIRPTLEYTRIIDIINHKWRYAVEVEELLKE